MDKQPWHYFIWDDAEYLVIGYNPKELEDNRCSIVCLHALDKRDQDDLCRLVDTEAAQQEPYLASLLVKAPYMSGSTWWEFLSHRVLIFRNIKYLIGRVASSQMAIFHHAQQDFDAKKYGEGQNYAPDIAKTGNKEDILYGRIN